jgi:hypothetical protein
VAGVMSARNISILTVKKERSNDPIQEIVSGPSDVAMLSDLVATHSPFELWSPRDTGYSIVRQCGSI